jgi:glycosyltransferase involved in cell wall biosynthesis
MTAELATPPKVSVVMGCYNCEGTVADAIRSIQAQTLRDWELIVIDDGSTDNTASVVRQLAVQDPRIRMFQQPNRGLTLTLIDGCRLAQSPIIARQDADDRSLPDRLSRQYEVLCEQPAVGLVSCFADYIGPENEYLSTVTRPKDPFEATRCLLDERMGPPAHGTVMFRKAIYEQVGGYRRPFYYAQDSDLWMRMAEVSQIAYVQESGYQFRWHGDSITGTGRALQEEFGRLGQECRKARRQGTSEAYLLAEVDRLRTTTIAQRQSSSPSAAERTVKHSQLAMNYFIGTQLVRNKDVRARAYLQSVLRERPWHWKAWIRLGQSLFSGEKRVASGEGLQQ